MKPGALVFTFAALLVVTLTALALHQRFRGSPTSPGSSGMRVVVEYPSGEAGRVTLTEAQVRDITQGLRRHKDMIDVLRLRLYEAKSVGEPGRGEVEIVYAMTLDLATHAVLETKARRVTTTSVTREIVARVEATLAKYQAFCDSGEGATRTAVRLSDL